MIFGAAIVIAVCAGISIAIEDYWLLWLGGGTVILIGLLITPGYSPLLVVGLLIPFSLPLPLIWNLPVLTIVLGICIVKYWFERGLTIHRHSTPLSTMNWSCGLFFGWVLIRYCINPSIPNFMGFGRNVTGFRSWLNYALSLGVLFFMGRFVGNRQGLLKLIRWLVIVSVFFSVLLLAAAFSGSMQVAMILSYLGMVPGSFDNGMLRFVGLPAFGVILLSVLLLPNLLKVNRLGWWIILFIGSAAVVVGGNRSGFGIAIIVVTVILLLRSKFLACAAVFGTIVVVCAGVYLAGPFLAGLPHTGVLRMFALVSPELAEATGGDNSLEWREVLWQRAEEEIGKHPLVGQGYTGVENGLELDHVRTMEETEELTLATGGIHDGYLASALALGIPAAILFIFILGHQIFLNARRGYRLQKEDSVIAEAHCFVCANLLGYAAAIFIGSDLNAPMIWFAFALGLFLFQLRPTEKRHPKTTTSVARPVLAEQIA
ncbi:MAG TPA: O-antigen ligase family protein [Verrucomicrobiae bacterium]|nr:O-antigen ligase family protein [Verrucomicrobiae bacterium]